MIRSPMINAIFVDKVVTWFAVIVLHPYFINAELPDSSGVDLHFFEDFLSRERIGISSVVQLVFGGVKLCRWKFIAIGVTTTEKI